MYTAPTEVFPTYAVVGHDRLLRGEVLEGILERLSEEMDTLGPVRFAGPQAALADVLDEVRTQSLLGDRRVVVVDEADSFITANRAALERYCSSPSGSGSLILMCDTLARNTRLYKIINTAGAVVACDAPKGRAVVEWIVNRAQTKYGKGLSHPAARMLREHLGDALGELDAELSKLTAYVGGRSEITPGDIDALTGHHREEKVFAVTDAISSHDTAAALGHWEQVLTTDRAAPARAIAGLAWGVRRLLEARRDWERGVNLRELARRMYTDPALLKRRLERVTAEQLEEQQRDLLAADLAVKTGASTIDLAVEKFIVKHSAGAPSTH
ncbi:MAG: DNA polymerase III subunit delta [Phycisphaerales bacterium]|nr:MAG: DNA polymerase III subunit delta [Phycisphaerales bacterium]